MFSKKKKLKHDQQQVLDNLTVHIFAEYFSDFFNENSVPNGHRHFVFINTPSRGKINRNLFYFASL